ncbi:MAG: AAA family ATPase [Pirellulaceae bacterium]
MTILDKLKAARRVSVPIVGISTPDPAATVELIVTGINGDSPKLQWDSSAGMRPLNEEAAPCCFDAFDIVQACQGALSLPEGAILIVHMTNRWLDNPLVLQAIWNVRDAFKENHRMLVLLGPDLELPAELKHDVVLLDEPLPGRDALREIVLRVYRDAALDDGDAPLDEAVDALQGLSAFQAEQVTAMSLTREGLDIDAVWELKRKQIEQTPGLSVWRGGERFDDIGGVSTVKDFIGRIVHGKAKPGAVVFIDEIEKMLAGEGDLSGVSQDQLGAILSYMQDENAVGMIFVGPPGSAKSMVAKAAGNEAGIPTIQLDLGASKGSLVGQSENQMRQALKVVSSVSNGRSLWIATCNKLSNLPPELRRRFTLGTFFFDLPPWEERVVIWALYKRRYSILSDEEAIDDADWTGAEIRQCCDIAWRLDISLDEAAKFIVPVAKSAAQQIAKLRSEAVGKFLSASQPGTYRGVPITRESAKRSVQV